MSTENQVGVEQIAAFGAAEVLFVPFDSENHSFTPDPLRLARPPRTLESYDPLRYFKSIARKIEEVERIYFSYQAIPAGKDIVHFYTIIDKDDHEVRRRIYAAEMSLMNHFPKHSYNFDFHVVARRGKEIAEVLKSPGCSELFDKNAPA
jgi:hypothetical protein